MTHEGELGHPIGCNCLECVEGRQMDTQLERAIELRDALTQNPTQAQRENITRELRGIEARLDRQ